MDTERKFPWGRVISDVTVGPYMVRSYHPHKPKSREIDDSEVFYHGYIDGKDCNESWISVDEALAGLIVRRALGPNWRPVNEHFIAGIRALAVSP
jgi:hypothetical protein